MYMGKSILVGVPLGNDYKIDARIKDTLSLWEYTIDKVEVYHPVSSSPELGRDMIMSYAKYRIPNPSHILFLDCDILPRKATIDRLLKMDKDIVMGVYPMSQDGKIKWSVSTSDVYEGIVLDKLPRNPFKIKSGGFGVCLIKYEVFEHLEWPYWKNIYVPGGVKMGEDIYFCKKAREAGYDIWCDPLVKCGHIRITNLFNIVQSFLKEIKNGSKI